MSLKKYLEWSGDPEQLDNPDSIWYTPDPSGYKGNPDNYHKVLKRSEYYDYDMENVKKWSEMTRQEKERAYDVAIESGNVDDTFDGFSKAMYNATFDTSTWKLIEY